MKLNILFSGDDRYTITIDNDEDKKFHASICVGLETLKELRARIDYIIRRECEIELQEMPKTIEKVEDEVKDDNLEWTKNDDKNFYAINRILYGLEYPSLGTDNYTHEEIVNIRKWYFDIMNRIKKK